MGPLQVHRLIYLLAITWSYDDNITIHGEAYFAITPKVCMGGGALLLRYQSSSIDAHLAAHADFLINYRPFSFMADFGIEIGVNYTAGIGFLSVSFEGTIGAQIHLHGPPVAGSVDVDLHIYSFTITFGQTDIKNDALIWTQFCSLIRQEQTEQDYSADTVGGQHMHNIEGTKGIISDSQEKTINVKSSEEDPWLVDGANFAFSFSSLFPLTRHVFAATDTDVTSSYHPCMKPMHISGNAVVSQVTITIVRTARDDGGAVGDTPSFGIQTVVKQVPSAVWGPCK